MEHEYTFNYPDYFTYNKFVNTLRKNYQRKYSFLYKKYTKSLQIYNEITYKKLLSKKMNLDIKYLKKVILKFNKYLKKEKSVIFIHGSYSKKINRWHSDIDINILYKEEPKFDYFVLEEMIVCAIYKILGMAGRDKVHTMMIYLPDIENTELNLSNNYSIRFNDGNKFNYVCRNNFEKVYAKLINSSRNYKDFCDYIINFKGMEEWVYSYKGLNIRSDKLIRELLDKKDYNLKKHPNNYFDFIKNFINKLKFVSLSDIKTVSVLNKNLKVNNLNKVYNMLLILKEFIVLKNGKCENIDIYKIRNNKILKEYINIKYLEEFFKYLYKYLFFVDRLEELFFKININFSSREYSGINIKKLKEEYFKYYNSDFRKDYEIYKNFLNISKKILREVQKYER